jgi:manganese oxidase
MSTTARVAVVAMVGLLGAFLALIGIGHGHGISTAHSATVQTRTYYVAADEVNWDYAPQGKNMITGQPFTDDENVFVQNGPDRIGSTYRKALYREYTDATFTKLKPKDPKWEHTGFLGPVIRAEVGDTIKVVFRNNGSQPYSIHAHGVLYDKASEGAPYNDGTGAADKADDAVPPGGTYTYVYKVPPRAGPGPHDGNSVMWMYHSHTDEIADTNSGLVGPMIIYSDGALNPDGSVVGVDKEFIAFFSVMNENESNYLDWNIKHFATQPSTVKADSDDFGESNLMHSINGYVYGNGPMMKAKLGERVRWYVMSLGTEVDLHTPHWHGNTITTMGMRTDVAQILAGGMVTADMEPDDPGIWLLHCHINDHIAAGMSTRYQIVP